MYKDNLTRIDLIEFGQDMGGGVLESEYQLNLS